MNSKLALVLIPFMCLLPALRKPKERQKDSFVLERRVCKLLRRGQVLQPCIAVILLSVAVFPFSLVFTVSENICDVEINSCKNKSHLQRMICLRVALSVVHMTIAIFLEKDNMLFSFSQFIMGSLLCALVCLCKFLLTFVHSL